jgi:YHS domain-containing protein
MDGACGKADSTKRGVKIKPLEAIILKIGKSGIIAIAVIICGISLAGCRASDATSAAKTDAAKAGVEPFFKSTEGLALKGYDPVAYFTDNKPAAGLGDFELDWKGAKWRFATARNRELFTSEPEKYAPQYGGYCAWAVGHGYTAKGDPETWKIVDGKLYLNYNRDVKAKWEQETQELISKGNENWSSFQTAKPEHKGEGAN